ncbi:MAG: secretin N-terminal domain-containing protein [Betaproteobacteria bacterium]|nr:secretin N-terminal domain-containing protein [Betaproteobacteria bacterium]
MKTLAVALGMAILAGCAAPPRSPPQIDERIAAEILRAGEARKTPPADTRVQDALLPPLKMELPRVTSAPADPKFDLAVNNAPAAQVFMSIVSGTRYSMLVAPEVTGNVTVNLKDVTVMETLNALRELYGYEYKLDGTRIFIQPPAIRTRVFQVNYLVAQRLGRTDMRVTSGSVADTPIASGAAGVPGVPGTTGLPAPGAPPTAGAGAVATAGGESSRVQTSVRSDFWEDLRQTLAQIIGTQAGRSVVVNPQAGLVVVRAMPSELRDVENYLRAIRLSVERQVMLEAKIVEVTLTEQNQAGINWTLFSSPGNVAAGMINPNTTLGTAGALSTGGLTANPGLGSLVAGGTGTLIGGVPGGALLGLAFQTKNIAAVLQFLESQGAVQVLSSPRMATLNNQKAVLKVGTDEFFITNIAGGSATVGTTTGGTTSFPTLTLRPFFSGVALDVTPQIDEDGSIILHMHPSVSLVSQDDKNVNLGAVFGGQVTLPLARSTISETDSVVRVQDGNVVAVGGLMKLDINDNRSGVPGLRQDPGVGRLFGSDARTSVKKELVILIKPTVIASERDWAGDLRETRERLLGPGAAVPGR